MSIKKDVIAMLSNVVINVISNDVSDEKMNIIEKIDVCFFKTKIKKRINGFCKGKDGSVLTSGQFQIFIKYHNPFERIYEHIMGCNTDGLSKDELIKKLVEETKSTCNNSEFRISVCDESILKELFSFVYSEYGEYCKKRLTINEKYMVANISNHQDEQTKKIIDEIGDIKALVSGSNVLINSEDIIKVYDILNSEVKNGNLEKVHDILTILNEKNRDIDLAIRIEMALVSDYVCLDLNIMDAWRQIKSKYISDDVARYLILYWFSEKDRLSQLASSISNDSLKNIIQDVCDDRRESFINIESKKTNHANTFNYSLVNQYNDEKWLVSRICVIWICENAALNIHEVIRLLLHNNLSFVEELFVLEKEQEAILTTMSQKEIKSDRMKELKSVLLEIKPKIVHGNKWIKEKFYELLLRSLIILDEDYKEILYEIPGNIKRNTKISSLILQCQINQDDVSEEEIFEYCEEKEEYWLYNNFLVRMCKKPEKIQQSLEKHNSVLKKDISLFLMYIQAVRINNGKQEACRIMNIYKEYYVDDIEYWIEIIKLADDKKTELYNTYRKWNNEELKYINLNSEIEFAELLANYGMNKEAMQIIQKMETLGKTSSLMLKVKARILVEDQPICAFNILQEIFDEYSRDLFVVDTSIVLALNIKREIPQKVVEAAIDIGTSRLFMLVSIVYSRKNKKTDAKYYMTKALLRNDENSLDVYCNYFMLNLKFSDDSVREINGVEEDTAVFLTKKSGEQNVYCIYSDNVLPESPYNWENATHIYRDEAITYGIVRRKIGDMVSINGEEYTISDVMPVECYLIRVCVSKLAESNLIQQVSIDTQADGNINIEHLTNELKKYLPEDKKTFDCLENYKDLSNWPLPFYVLQRSVRFNATQLLISFMKDKNIIIRELYGVDYVDGGPYILSFASVIILCMLGIRAQYLCDKKVIIPSSLKITLLDMCMEIIEENDKDNVSALGVLDDQLYMNITTEEEKVQYMKEATALKQFVIKLDSCDNNSEFQGINDDRIDMLDTFGISDYDALALAQSMNGIVVAGEVTIMSLIQMYETNVKGVGILNFLIGIGMELFDLLDCMKKMVEYRFLITLTTESIFYILSEYDNLENIDMKEKCMEKWIDYLSTAESMEADYKNIFMQNMGRVYQTAMEHKIDVLNPIWRNFVFFFIKYNNIRIEVRIGEDGNYEVITHKLEEINK